MTELKEKALDRLKAIFPNHCEDMLSDIVIALENDCGSLTEDKLIVRCVNQILEGEQAAEKRLKVAKQGTTIAGKRMICERRITRSLTRKDNSRKADTKGLRKGRSKKTMPPARKGKKARPTTEYREEEQTAADGSPTTSSSDKSSSTDRDAHLEVSLSPRSSSSYGLSSMSLDNSVDSSKIGLKMGHGEGNAATLMKDWLAKCGPSKDGKDVKDGEDVTNRSPITGDEGETTQSSADGRLTPTFSELANSRDGLHSDIFNSDIPFSPAPSTTDACSNSDLEIISLGSTAGAKSRDTWSQESQCGGRDTSSNEGLDSIDKSNGNSTECDNEAKKLDMDVVDIAEEASGSGTASAPSNPVPSHQSMNTTEDSSENESVIDISDSVDSLSDSVININDTPRRKDSGVIDISDIVELESPRRLPQLLDSGFNSSRKVCQSEDMPIDPLDLSVTDMDDTDTSITEEGAGDQAELTSVDRLQTSDSVTNQIRHEHVTDIPAIATSEVVKAVGLTTSKQKPCGAKETMGLSDHVLVSDNMAMEQDDQKQIVNKQNKVAEFSKTKGKHPSCVTVDSESESEFYISSSESDDPEDSSEQTLSASASASASASTSVSVSACASVSVSTSASTSVSASLGTNSRQNIAVQIAQVSSSSPDVVYLGKQKAVPTPVPPVILGKTVTTCDTGNYKELKHKYHRMKNVRKQLLSDKSKADPVYCKKIHETCEQLKKEIRKKKHDRRKKVEQYIKSLKVHKIDIVDGSTLRVTNTKTDKPAVRRTTSVSHPTQAHPTNNSQSSSALSFMKIIGEARKLLTGKDSTESIKERQSSQNSLLPPNLSLSTAVTTCTTVASNLFSALLPRNV
ncbi:serine-rich adhesin for platelets-like isoform X2 [Haliotis rubra]|uniref:serine-rich adhesin for platelets-like isoform X2 n=1 Tax=Haliotis rubra TaxID=36100 RepID=UPI001EE548B0|nr:serine-rich adhesin for platelets-like isoform X2 [Haliotis rubra]